MFFCGLHGANRLGSNSLAELVVFGRLAGEQAMQRAKRAKPIAPRWTRRSSISRSA
jgi:succinate dehydrogenase/fumarate reductase flavoprotein subunit